MVNNRTKSYLRFGMSLFGIAFFLTTCEKDSFAEEETLEITDSQPPISIKTIDIREAGETFDHLKDTYQLKNHLGIQNLGNTQQKSATETANAPGIVIYTDEVREITQGDYTSYTMKIASLDDDPNTFYNITIEDKNGTEGMFVTQYKKESSNGDVQNKRYSSISTERINDITEPLDPGDFGNEDPGTSPGSGGGGSGGDNTQYPTDCDGSVITTTVLVPFNCGCGHSPTSSGHNYVTGCTSSYPPHPGYENQTTYECIPAVVGNPPDEGDPNDGNPPNNAGGVAGGSIVSGSGDSLNPSLTSPVGKEVGAQSDDDPCKQLNLLTSPPAYNIPNPFLDNSHPSNSDGKNSKIRTALINIDSELDSNWEHGYGFYNRGQYPNYGPYAQHVAAPPGGKTVNFPARAYQFGTVHTHPVNDEAIPMFSADDLYSLLHIRNYYTNGNLQQYNTAGDNLFVSVLVVEQNSMVQTYAIKIEDIVKLQQLEVIHQKEKDWVRYSDKFDKKFTDEANGINGGALQYQKVFLSFIKDQDLGIGLYKMEQINLGTPFVEEQWKKLTLNENNQVEETPCN